MRQLRVLLLVVLLPAAARAQSATPSRADAYVGKPVVAVHLVSEGRPADEPALVDLVETPVGQPLSMAAVRESITHLFSLGRFEDVQVDATAVEGGVALRYDLVPVHNVSRVDFRGNLGVSDGLLRRAMSDRFSATPAVGRAAEVARVLEQAFYPDQGYMRASVKWAPIVAHDPDRTFLSFEIDAGPRAVIRNVDITGDLPDGRAVFQKGLDAVPGDPYRPPELRSALADYVQKLRKRGRYEAAATFVPTVSADGTAVDLRFDVQSGPVVTVTFSGDPLPADKLKELVPVEREGSVDQDLLEDSARRITDYLNQQGYWKATASSAREEAPGAVSIVFTVRKGLQYFIGDRGVDVSGSRAVSIDQIRPMLERLQPHDLYLESNLGAAVAGIADLYRRLGFATVSVKAAANELNPAASGQGQVQPAIVIEEGPRTIIGTVTFTGNEHLSTTELGGKVNIDPGAPYYEPRIEEIRQAIVLEYLNAGFASAGVVVKPIVSVDGTRADLPFHVTEGPQTIVDHIIIVGNTHTDPRIIQRELLIRPGQPLGLEDRLESQRRLAQLGLFRRIRIEELPHSSRERRDVLVSVEEAATTTLSYGGGLEITRRLRATGPSGEAEEHLEFAPRGFFGIGRRNIAGKNRSISLYTRVSLRPGNSPNDPARDGTGFGFNEYRVVGTYREPRALGTNAEFGVTAALEQGIRTGFNFIRKGVNADVTTRVGRGIRMSARYSFGTTRTFQTTGIPDEQLSDADQALIDRIFPQVRLSAFSGAISRDTRDDLVEPTSGAFMSGEATVAARALGGQVGFLKSYAQGFWFRRLPGSRRLVLATRAAVGLADGFPREVTTTNASGEVKIDVIEDLPASERFFAGGDTTIRGFALDTVGAADTISEKGFPKGGNAVLIMNAELRVPVWREFGAAFFVDGGNVFNRVSEFDFGELRGSFGLGLRYRSPLGPIRLDVGFKMDRREVGGTLEPRRAFHFSIGQAF